jgi:predicted HTH transcriptional regulator
MLEVKTMMDVLEDKRNEFKIKLTDNLEKEVIAFLNTDGGNIFIGIDDKGNISGNLVNIDLLQRTIKDRIKDNIMPSTLGLFDVVVNEKNKKRYIQIIVAKGTERPYYLRGMGMTPDSCFVRIGSSVESMSNETILNLFSKRTRNSLKNIKSPNQDLEFKTLKIYYQENGYEINDNFLKKLDFYTEDNNFNYAAYLLSDNNNISIQFAKYSGDDVYNLIENEDFGSCSMIKSMENILNKINIENKIFTKIEVPTRKEIKQFDFYAVKELVTNAFVHNDWSNGYSPKFEIFDNKLVISSNGGIQEGVTQEEFLEGFSNPRNPELMRIFRDLNYVEQLGTGIQRVLKTYDKNIFEFFANHIRVTIPFKSNCFNEEKSDYIFETKDSLNNLQNSILKLIMDKPNITQEELARLLDVNKRTIIRNFKVLLENNYIERIGANKNGYWKITK